MNIEKLSVPNATFELNLKFYFWLKYLIKTNLTNKQTLELLEITLRASTCDNLKSELEAYIARLKSASKAGYLTDITATISEEADVALFLFSLRLYCIKDVLLAEAKCTEVVKHEELAKLDPLSLAYDKHSIYAPYATRVNGALLALLFFERLESGQTNLISAEASNFVAELSSQAIALKELGLEPNQIFMLMFSESINQSIISDSGSNYEDRLHSVLVSIGISRESISKVHDSKDASTEFDFFFDLDGRKYGIGAKRTLRERYKQFIKTVSNSDANVMIEVTLGLDLNEDKAKTIVGYGIVIFVADEIYQARPSLQAMEGVYSTKALTLETLRALQ
jgi:hypothetical protein